MEAGPIMYDRKPVIMKDMSPNLDMNAEDVSVVVSTWIRFVGSPLQYQGQNLLHKPAGLIGKPIRTYKATAQKEVLIYARILVEISINHSQRR